MLKDRKTERQKDKKTKRQKDRKTERQKDRKTKRQKDRKTERQTTQIPNPNACMLLHQKYCPNWAHPKKSFLISFLMKLVKINELIKSNLNTELFLQTFYSNSHNIT